MKIETKLKIGDKFWYIRNLECYKDAVVDIYISVASSSVSYIGYNGVRLAETEIYATEKEAIEENLDAFINHIEYDINLHKSQIERSSEHVKRRQKELMKYRLKELAKVEKV